MDKNPLMERCKNYARLESQGFVEDATEPARNVPDRDWEEWVENHAPMLDEYWHENW
jgi:hypothetical protein